MVQNYSIKRLLTFSLPLPLTEIKSPAFMVVLLLVTVAQFTRTSPLLDRQQLKSVRLLMKQNLFKLAVKLSFDIQYEELSYIVTQIRMA